MWVLLGNLNSVYVKLKTILFQKYILYLSVNIKGATCLVTQSLQVKHPSWTFKVFKIIATLALTAALNNSVIKHQGMPFLWSAGH